ncbi:zinc ribbon domain-containing protein [Halorientalis salina]|uniref:zinc ribbon domain-containing protein n=1 Tax=Halorientalis salina TaxID=2932266 RepID=UPI0010ABA7EB|nr:zinc ribbon domain-containing protein [Halorientalis salina]
MGKDECWNCGESISVNANYCTQCTYPVDGILLLREFMRLEEKKQNILENGAGVLVEGLHESLTKEEIRDIKRELESGDS